MLSISPGGSPTLQQAIEQAGPGDVIELANGTYLAPDGGFRITNAGKSITIRSASGDPADVALDGQHLRPVLQLLNTDVSLGGVVRFEGLTFRNGSSELQGVAGGVTLQQAQAYFERCRLEGNRANVAGGGDTGGGGANISEGSRATLTECTFADNASGFYGGGLAVETGAQVSILASQFQGNRTNLPGHSPTAAGGAIHVGNAALFVRNTRFENNAAGFAGGAVFAIGTWDEGAEVEVRNCTFFGNRAERDGSVVSDGTPVVGGDLHAEDLASVEIHASRFLENEAMDGGGVSLYRADVGIHDSVFRDNVASGDEPRGLKGLGGAISAVANDVDDATTEGGAINRRPSQLVVSTSLLQGRSSGTGAVAGVGGCLYAAGDAHRTYGSGGVTQDGTAAENRTGLTLHGVVFHDCDVQQNSLAGTGSGGAFATDLVHLDVRDVLVVDSDAVGSESSGGGALILDQSEGMIESSTFARNTAERYGAAVLLQGSHVELGDLTLVENEISPGVSEADGSVSFGAALFGAPDVPRGLPVEGFLADSIVSRNVGLPLFDDDYDSGAINDLHYEANDIFSETFGPAVYTNSLPFLCCKSVAELNALVVSRGGSASTDKSLLGGNVALDAPPATAKLLAVPRMVVSEGAAGDPPGPAAAFLGWAWSGPDAPDATCDGFACPGRTGLVEAGVGSYQLSSGSVSVAAQILVPELSTGPARGLALLALAVLARRRTRPR